MANELHFLLKKLIYYPHILDLIYFYLADINRVILNNQIININTSSIQLCYNNYTNNNIFLLLQNIPWSPVKHLYLSSNKLTNIHLLCKKLKYTKIESLYLCDNLIEDITPLHFFENSKLKVLTLAKNKIKNINPVIKLIQNSNLERLILLNNNITNINNLLNILQFSNLEYLCISTKILSGYDKNKIDNGIRNKNNKLI